MPTYVLPETVSSKTRHGFVMDRVRELINVEVAASAPAGEVVVR
jgi:hypothetical protein